MVEIRKLHTDALALSNPQPVFILSRVPLVSLSVFLLRPQATITHRVLSVSKGQPSYLDSGEWKQRNCA